MTDELTIPSDAAPRFEPVPGAPAEPRPDADVAADDPIAVLRARAAAAERAEELGAAVRLYSDLLKLRPAEVAGSLALARVHERRGDPDRGVEALDRAVAGAPDDVALLLARASLLTSRMRYEPAEADLRRVLRHHPEHAEALLALGVVLLRGARLREALEALRDAAALAPSGAVHYYLGEALNRVGQPEAAIEAFETSLRFDPDSARAYKGMGMALDGLKRPQDAAAAYRRAAELQRR